ncbi:MAG: transglycosylase domain-containing protein, partial [Pseudomonadota bacterium]
RVSSDVGRPAIEEQALAVMLEARLSKDQILEMYLNVIYMGQNGPYQVRGLGSAAQYYFDKNPENPYCMAVAAPKAAKIRAKYATLIKG